MASEPLYVTTPLFYVNADPHLGHTYATPLGDVLARFWRARGRAVFTLTGTDEHGDKIAQAAAAAGVDPKVHADRVSGLFRSTWEAMDFRYDHFIRTTDAYHVAFVRRVLDRIHTRGTSTSGATGAFTAWAASGSIRSGSWWTGAARTTASHRPRSRRRTTSSACRRTRSGCSPRWRRSPTGSRPTATGARCWPCCGSRSATSASRGRKAAFRGASSYPSTIA